MSVKPKVFLSADEKKNIFARAQASAAPLTTRKWAMGPAKREITIELAELQSWRCFWCGRTMTNDDPDSPTYRTLEHLVPKGSLKRMVESVDNFRAACMRCNSMRSIWNMEFYEAMLGSLYREAHMRDEEIETLEMILGWKRSVWKWIHKLRLWRKR